MGLRCGSCFQVLTLLLVSKHAKTTTVFLPGKGTPRLPTAFVQQRKRKASTMSQASDRPFGWVAALAVASGAAVLVPSLAVLAISLLAVAAVVF
jgi:hypothetical protein